MRSALTMAFLSAAALLAAGPVAPASPPSLTLQQAVDRTLRHNLGLAVTRLDAWRALDAVDVSLSVFDPTLAWTNRLSGSRTPDDIQLGDPAARFHDSDLSLSQRNTWGGTLSLGTGLTRTWASSGSLGLASSYALDTNIAYTQPLLAGGWQAVNLTALISARQAALRSRLSLRATALDLIRDAEVGYWTLASARALVAFRETSLRSATSLLEQIKARRSLGDATILDELQAEADVAAQRVGVLNARQALDNAEMSLRRLLGQGTADDVDQPLAVDALPTTAVPAAAPFSPWIRVVADFDFATEIQRANIVQAEALVAQAEQNDRPASTFPSAPAVTAPPGPSAGASRMGWTRIVARPAGRTSPSCAFPSRSASARPRRTCAPPRGRDVRPSSAWPTSVSRSSSPPELPGENSRRPARASKPPPRRSNSSARPTKANAPASPPDSRTSRACSRRRRPSTSPSSRGSRPTSTRVRPPPRWPGSTARSCPATASPWTPSSSRSAPASAPRIRCPL